MVKANLPTFLAASTANHVKTDWKLTNQSSARELGKFPVYKRERGCRSHKAFLRNLNGNLFCIFQVLKFPPLYTFLYKLWITITQRDHQFLNKLACILFIYLQYSTGNSRFLQENSQEKKARNTTCDQKHELASGCPMEKAGWFCPHNEGGIRDNCLA